MDSGFRRNHGGQTHRCGESLGRWSLKLMSAQPSSPSADAVTELFSAEQLRVFCCDLLGALGVAPAHAHIVADSLVAANLRGVDSHGIQMIVTYVQQLRAGGINVPASGHVVREDGVCLRYHGENG